VRCELAEREISARLDGAGVGASSVDDHLAGCPSCTSFAAAAERIRESARLEVADAIPPGLLGAILERVESSAGARTQSWRLQRSRGGGWRALRPHFAAFVAGAVGTAIVLGGPMPPAPVMAGEIGDRLVEASLDVTGYSAEFRITERNFRLEIPEREFVTEVSYGAKERFRAVTRDLSRYPSAQWPRNDLTLEVQEGRWRLDAPLTCPRQALPACTKQGREIRSVTGREPFDADAALPTDMILPLRTLAGTDKIDIVGQSTVGGRRAVQVRLAYRDARPLFAFLRAGGSWRPLFPTDVVTLSLDTENWFPLAFDVTAGESDERAAWAQAEGLGHEEPGSSIFEVRVEDIKYRPAGPSAFSGLPRGARDGGFVDQPFDQIETNGGYAPLVPVELEGMTAYRSGVFSDPGRTGEILVSFSRGLSWLKIRQTRTWSEPSLFGNVGPLAERVELPGAGVAYYEPATDILGRRLSIHAEGIDLYLETNLPADQLFEIAGSLPVRGLAMPEEWSVRTWPGGIVREMLSLEDAIDQVPYLKVPTKRPEGYELAAVYLVRSDGGEGVTMSLRRTGMETDGVGIRVHQAPGIGLAPPMDPSVRRVQIGDLILRYSPRRGELEWVEGGIYNSIAYPAADLQTLTGMVRSMSRQAREDRR
jgi:hypothetical protein